MAQNADQSGADKLEPISWQVYYPNVQSGAFHNYLTVWCECNSPEEMEFFEELAPKYPTARFYLDNVWDTNSFLIHGLQSPNITNISVEALSEKDKLYIWRNVDYIVGNTTGKILKAGLSGVAHIQRKDISKILSENKIPTAIDRVNAFETARTLLDTLGSDS